MQYFRKNTVAANTAMIESFVEPLIFPYNKDAKTLIGKLQYAEFVDSFAVIHGYWSLLKWKK